MPTDWLKRLCPHFFGWQGWRVTGFVNVRQCRWCGARQRARDGAYNFERLTWERIDAD